jgi:7,8-dihydropterin-6-yl-methyl-4-(beta-D-ribofuranosyl)aminobenzene 5'-phosphate synthase
MATSLVEIDSLSAIVIVDNELDPMSWIAPNTVDVTGHWMDLGLAQKEKHHDRGDATEIPMEALCCGAHGLSVLLVNSDIQYTFRKNRY